MDCWLANWNVWTVAIAPHECAVILGHVPIWAYGTEEQKQRFLPRLATGELIRVLWPYRAESWEQSWRYGNSRKVDAQSGRLCSEWLQDLVSCRC